MISRKRDKIIAWGDRARVQTGFKKYYDYLCKEYQDWFPKRTDLFQISAALGIQHNKQLDTKKREDLANLINLNIESFRVLISLRFPDKTSEEKLEELEKYADYGIKKLYDGIREDGLVGFMQYVKPVLDSISATSDQER